MTKDALQELLAKVESGGDVYGFGAVGTPLIRGYAEGAYNGSLDAALALHEAVLPGWGWGRRLGGEMFVVRFLDGHLQPPFSAYDNNPARAWLIAILKALIAETDDE